MPSKVADPALKQQADALAAEIDRVYAPRPLGDVLEENAKAFTAAPSLQKLLIDARADYAGNSGPEHRYRVTAKLLADLRDALPKIQSPAGRLRVLDLSLAVEAENFRASAEARSAAAKTPRGSAVVLLAAGAEAAYGTGMINARERAELRKAFAKLVRRPAPARRLPPRVALSRPRSGLGHAGASHAFRRGDGQARRDRAPAGLFVQDQLRGSPLLFYSQTLDGLSRDANQLAGVQHKLLGKDIGAGFNALNPGLARGVLRAIARHEAPRGLPAGWHLRAAGDASPTCRRLRAF